MSSKRKAPRYNRSKAEQEENAAARRDAVQEITYTQIDSVSAHPQPGEIEHGWHYLMLKSSGQQQQALFKAEGADAAKDAVIIAARTKAASDTAEKMLSAGEKSLSIAEKNHDRSVEILGGSGYSRRTPAAKKLYYWLLFTFALADMVGVAATMYFLGEHPVLAVMMGSGTGAAAVACGFLGRDLADAKLAAELAAAAEGIPQEHKDQYPALFVDSKSGASIANVMKIVGLVTVGMLSVGVGTLRAFADTSEMGWIFAAFTSAIIFASVINNYAYHDKVAAIIEADHHRLERARREQAELAASPAITEHAGAVAEEKSILESYNRLGEAEIHGADAEIAAANLRNSHVLGHGPAPRIRDASGAEADDENSVETDLDTGGRVEATADGRRTGKSAAAGLSPVAETERAQPDSDNDVGEPTHNPGELIAALEKAARPSTNGVEL